MPAAGYPFHRVKVRGIPRRNPLGALHAMLLALRATGRARRLLRATGANAVLGGGGYVAGPVGLAARTLRLPLALTEADSHLGVANRMLAPLARKVFLSFPIDGRDELPDGEPRALGDVVLCPQIVGDEWRWPLVHGLLHLLGHEHGAAMEARERAHLS